jgi:hypothetical protein
MIGIMSICKREAVASKAKRHAILTCHLDSSSVSVLISAALYWLSSQIYLPMCKCLFTEMALNAGWFRENICDGEARWHTVSPGKCCNLCLQQSWLWIQIHICRSLFSTKEADEFSSRQVGEIISRFEQRVCSERTEAFPDT